MSGAKSVRDRVFQSTQNGWLANMRRIAGSALHSIMTDSLRRTRRKVRHARKLRRPNTTLFHFHGDYATWQDAVRDSDGYDHEVIIEKTLAAMLKVKLGEAPFERDSVILDKPEYPFPLISCLLHIACGNSGTLRVLDFGGALGSSYFQCQPFLSGLLKLNWQVVELEGHVKCGKKFLEDDRLHFHFSMDEALAVEVPDVIVLSGVLQYVEDPYATLQSVMSVGCKYIVVDRLPLSKRSVERLRILTVPPTIFATTVPYWFLSEARVREQWGNSYVVVAEWEDPAPLRTDEEVLIRRGFFLVQR